jgi:two-component system chemotaxis sensor kinase CheA
MAISDMSQYLGIFLDEGREQLGLLEANILKMERGDHSAEILQILFRAAHTLKGSSRAMGFLTIGDLTHEMENVLDDLREGKLGVATPIVDALLDCLDALTALIASVAAQGTDTHATGKDIPALVARLHSLRTGHAEAPPRAAPPGSAPPAPPVSLPVSPYEQASINEARAAGLTVYHVAVVLHPDCLMKSVRVFMVLGALEPLGAVLVASPKEDDLEAENFDQAFDLLLASEAPQAGIEQALAAVSELESVAVRPWTPGRDEAAEAAPPSSLIPDPSSLFRGAPAAPAQTIRVDVPRLDSLLNLIGELVIDRTQIARIGGDLQARYGQDELVGQLIEVTHRVARITAELQDEIMKTRLLPIDGVFQRMPRMVRDLAQKTGKEVDFRMHGGETELDRSVLEVLGDPLIHLLRNSVDHGVETPDDRAAAGKPRRGTVTLSARHEENHIVIEIVDDGTGIDPVQIKAAAVRKGLITPAAADGMGDRDALGLIFASGFSTAKQVSDISGRGVGMDIVRSNLEKIGGRILIESKVGQGTQFTIHLPLTLAIVRALLVQAGGGAYVLPLSSIVEMLRLGDGNSDITRSTVGGQAVMVLRGRTVPLASLADVLCGDRRATLPERIAPGAYVVVVGWAEKQIGLCVDALAGEQEVVIKSLGTLLGDIPGFSGATILGDGRIALIVDAAKALESIPSMARPELVSGR